MGGKCCTERKKACRDAGSEGCGANECENDDAAPGLEKDVFLIGSIAKNGGAGDGVKPNVQPQMVPMSFKNVDDFTLLETGTAALSAEAIHGLKVATERIDVRAVEAENMPADIEASDCANTCKRWRSAATHIKMARSVTMAATMGRFNVEQAVGDEAVAEAVDEEFDTLMAEWVPRSARGCGTVFATEGDGIIKSSIDRVAINAGPPPLPVGLAGSQPIMQAPKVEALPLPPKVDTVDIVRTQVNEITASKQRMDAALARIEARVNNASTKLQAVHRGRQVRKALAVVRIHHIAELGDPAEANAVKTGVG